MRTLASRENPLFSQANMSAAEATVRSSAQFACWYSRSCLATTLTSPPHPRHRRAAASRIAYRTADKTPLKAEVVAGKKNVVDFKLD